MDSELDQCEGILNRSLPAVDSSLSVTSTVPKLDLVWDQFRTTECIVYKNVGIVYSTYARNLSFNSKVAKFADLQNTEIVSQYTS